MSRKRKKNLKKKNQQPHPCPHCGATKTGRRCHSPACTILRNTPPKNAGLWTPWVMTALLTRMIGNAVIEDGKKDNDTAFTAIGERLFKWADKAAEEGKQFGVPVQYAQAQITKFDRAVNEIWPSNRKMLDVNFAEVLQLLVHDIIKYFTAKGYTPEQLKSWNWTEAALTALQKYYEADDLLKHFDSIEQDHAAFRRAFWNDTPTKSKPLIMWSVGGRFAVAAHDKYEAAAIVRKHYGLKGLKTKRLVLTTKVHFDGKETTYGALLDLFGVAGIVADFQEAA